MFFSLVFRLAAYSGAVASIVAHRQAAETGPAQGQRRGRPGQRYASAGKLTGNARNADTAPPATAASLAALNIELGQTWFSHRVVPGEVVKDTASV